MKNEKKDRISLHVSREFAEELGKKAKAQGCSLNEYCVNALETYEDGLVLTFDKELMNALMGEADGMDLDWRAYCYYILTYREVVSRGHLGVL